jgi:hypothetical protein
MRTYDRELNVKVPNAIVRIGSFDGGTSEYALQMKRFRHKTLMIDQRVKYSCVAKEGM